MSERKTKSVHSPLPSCRKFLAQSRHPQVARSITSPAEYRGGTGWKDGDQFNTKDASSSSASVNSAIVVMFSPRRSTLESRTRRSGPAMADKRPSSSRLTHGTTSP